MDREEMLDLKSIKDFLPHTTEQQREIKYEGMSPGI